MTNKKILILYNAVGLGHKSIAENIGYYLAESGYEIKLADVLQVQGNWLSKAGAWLYHLFITRFPFIWSFLYLNDWLTNLLLKFRTKIGGKNFENIKMMIDAFGPDMIISTHTVSSGIIAFLKQQGLFIGKFGIAFSDFHLHRYWLYDEADFYLVNIEEQKRGMEELGIERDRIYICGMLLKEKLSVNITTVKQKLGIEPDEKVILISSGSQGTGISTDMLTAIAKENGRKVIVVCGKNKLLFESLNDKFAGSSVLVLGFYTPMEELYAIADIYITKPGGLSTVEALRWNLPILVSHVLPGQEELNYEYLEDKGLIMAQPLTITGEVSEELAGHAFRNRLEINQAKQSLFPAPAVLLQAVINVLKDT